MVRKKQTQVIELEREAPETALLDEILDQADNPDAKLLNEVLEETSNRATPKPAVMVRTCCACGLFEGGCSQRFAAEVPSDWEGSQVPAGTEVKPREDFGI